MESTESKHQELDTEIEELLQELEKAKLKLTAKDVQQLVQNLSRAIHPSPFFAPFNLPGGLVGLSSRFRLQGSYRRIGKKFEVKGLSIFQTILEIEHLIWPQTVPQK